ncbi:hypothetical protein NM688_g6050 [Phlebia brevispora]|uniref:Uncharacterized protein n=1 Tax=Phlebia brevispora TaxID=194682 RepID=A0ACC1SKF0_9APHY|nr:hypothetical protein NM688_g6050 [Phlebia brevispora]
MIIGKSCGPNGLACASGTCTSLDLQCQTVGASLNLQKACPSHDDKSCQVSCQDPTSSDQCVELQSPLIDGSPCGYGGTCLQGSCVVCPESADIDPCDDRRGRRHNTDSGHNRPIYIPMLHFETEKGIPGSSSERCAGAATGKLDHTAQPQHEPIPVRILPELRTQMNLTLLIYLGSVLERFHSLALRLSSPFDI